MEENCNVDFNSVCSQNIAPKSQYYRLIECAVLQEECNVQTALWWYRSPFCQVILALSPFRINVTVTRQIAQAQDQVVASAQQVIIPSESTIAYGDWIYGVVNEDAPILRYYFEGQENDIVSVSMVRGNCGHNLDPYVALLSEDGVRIAEDDNSGFDDSASIYAYTLPKAGTYIVLASRAGMETGETSGDFNLALGTVNRAQL